MSDRQLRCNAAQMCTAQAYTAGILHLVSHWHVLDLPVYTAASLSTQPPVSSTAVCAASDVVPPSVVALHAVEVQRHTLQQQQQQRKLCQQWLAETVSCLVVHTVDT
jgi:hypothetical protein